PPLGSSAVWPPPPPPPPPPPTLPVAWLPLAALAKFKIVPVWADCETIPVPEIDTAVPGATLTTSPAAVVDVAVPPVTLSLIPHSSGRSCGVHGMIIISISAAMAAADGSANKPAKIKVFAQLCLYLTYGTLFSRINPQRERMTPPDNSNYPRIPSVP